MTIYFDMDGTIANFYAVDKWLDYLVNSDTTPYKIAQPMLNFSLLARLLNKIQKNGHRIGIISWTSKSGTETFNKAVTEVKKEWLQKHLPSVNWDEIHIVQYGYEKNNFANKKGTDILFDDETHNRENWIGEAKEPTEIINTLKELLVA